RLAREVRLDEVVDDRGGELALEVDDVVRDAEVRAHRAGVLGVARAAAPPARARRRAARVVEAHRHPDDARAALAEQRGRGGAVHATGQRGDVERPLRRHSCYLPYKAMKSNRCEVAATALDETGAGVGLAGDALVHAADLLPGERAEVVIDHESPHKRES